MQDLKDCLIEVENQLNNSSPNKIQIEMVSHFAELELGLINLPIYDGTIKHLTIFITQVDRYISYFIRI